MSRFLTITTTSPLDSQAKFLVRQVSGEERLGQVFTYELELLSPQPGLDASQIVGKTATVSMDQGTGQTRYLNGVIQRFKMLEVVGDQTRYRMTLVPWLWFLSLFADCRIFYKDKSVPDILKQIFDDSKYANIHYDDKRLKGEHPKREYTVQYRETDFNFVSRLMESEGIYYFFEHAKDKHTLVLADGPTAHEPAQLNAATLPYSPADDQNLRGEYIRDWTVDNDVRSSSVALNDFDFTAPGKDLKATYVEMDAHPLAPNSELYDFPGGYTAQSRGQTIAQVRTQEVQSQYETFQGTTNALGLVTGAKVTMSRHPVSSQNREYLIVGAAFSASSTDPKSNAGGTGGDDFTCSFDADVANEQYYPPRLTPIPYIRGPQTAIVVGAPGKEIDTDEYGRVKVQFHWDRKGKKDQNSSLWIRVAQVWAGKRWGATFTPRIGQEVVVEFLEGDPDHPIVTGSVYNGQQLPPYLGNGLDPKHKNDPNVSGVKSCSTLKGQGYNELRFDDTKGKEEIFLHAEKDLDTRVKNDTRTTVGGSRNLTVGGVDQYGNLYGDVKEKVFRYHQTHVRDTISVWADKNHNLTVGTQGQCMQVVTQDGNMTTTAQQVISVKAGQSIVLEAGMELCITCGPSFIKLGPDGVYISGPMVYINSGGSSTSGTDLDYVAPPEPDVADDSKSGLPSAPPAPS